MKTIAVTGGTGFIGRHLVSRFLAEGFSVRVLSRRPPPVRGPAPAPVMVEGDLLDQAPVRELVRGVDAIVHLAYSAELTDHEQSRITTNLVSAAIDARVGRFVHVGTAAVVGAVSAAIIDEETPSRPTTPYQRQKLLIESLLADGLRDRVPLVILRPTAVFGAGGKNLVKLANDLRHDSELVRWARLAVLRRRRLNLVCVENVVEAVRLIATTRQDFSGQRLIVSDDDDPMNEYESVCRFLAPGLGVRMPRTPVLPALSGVLGVLLRLRGRSLSNPQSVFTSRRLFAIGYRPAISFQEGLQRFCEWYRQEFVGVAR
jgi:nucleoside-diphosphate-sugar epimerase